MDYLYALQNIREMSPEFINYFFVFMSEVVVKGAIVLAAIIYWGFDKSNGASILLGYSSAYSVNQIIKNTACIYRPWILDSRLHVAPEAIKTATGYSFPSGHTVMASSIFGGIAIWKKDKKYIVALMAIFTILIAFSRNWLGAHTMKDVLVAVLVAGIVLCLATVIRYYVIKNPDLDSIVTIVMILLSVAVLIFLQYKKYPVDYLPDGSILVDPYDMLTDCYTACGMSLGGFIGWWLERRFVKFQTEVSKKEKIVRITVGLVVSSILYLGLGIVFKPLGPHFAHLLKYGLLFFAVLFAYPFVFWKVHTKKN